MYIYIYIYVSVEKERERESEREREREREKERHTHTHTGCISHRKLHFILQSYYMLLSGPSRSPWLDRAPWTLEVCKTMAFWATSHGFGPVCLTYPWDFRKASFRRGAQDRGVYRRATSATEGL